MTLTYLYTDLYFLCEYFFIPPCRQSPPPPTPYQPGFSNRDTVIGHVNMYLIKTNSEKKWYVPCLREEKVGKLVQVLHQTLVFFCSLVHDKSEISQHEFFLDFYKRVFNQLENIPPQNKDTEVVSVRKLCFINLS